MSTSKYERMEDQMIQTRSETNGLGQFNTLQEAIEASKKDKTIWKISFTLNGERVRMVRQHLNGVGAKVATNSWEYEPIV